MAVAFPLLASPSVEPLCPAVKRTATSGPGSNLFRGIPERTALARLAQLDHLGHQERISDRVSPWRFGLLRGSLLDQGLSARGRIFGFLLHGRSVEAPAGVLWEAGPTLQHLLAGDHHVALT